MCSFASRASAYATAAPAVAVGPGVSRARSASRARAAARISALPTALATTSVWIGWTAKRAPARAAVLRASPKRCAKTTTRAETPAWPSTFTR